MPCGAHLTHKFAIYLANRGIKAANVPIVPGCPLPDEINNITKPLIVGLTKDPKSLVQIRRNRLRLLNQDEETDYVDINTVSQEVNEAHRMFTNNNWPVIDVTRRSIEETLQELCLAEIPGAVHRRLQVLRR